MARDWGVESLRLTLFSPDTIALSDADWTAITGEQEAATRQVTPGVRRYVGSLLAGQFILSATGQRVDMTLSWAPAPPEQQLESDGAQLPIVGDWDSTRDAFVAATEKWLEEIKFPVVRMAFAPILLSETKSRLDSYQTLKSLLKSVNVDPDGMRELIFRVNWPTKSRTSKDLMLNRITNWTSIQVSAMVIQMTGQGISGSSGQPEKFAVRLEMDHNTDQDNKQPFERDVLLSIYKELVKKACENAESGERP
jgi:hypothetical protein